MKIIIKKTESRSFLSILCAVVKDSSTIPPAVSVTQVTCCQCHTSHLLSVSHNNHLLSVSHNKHLLSVSHNNHLLSVSHNNHLLSVSHNNHLLSVSHNIY